MSEILAKSDRTTLEQHINDLLLVAKALESALPVLPKIARKENFWELLHVAILFHDLGKTTPGFQKGLFSKRYHFRHEWLSAALCLNLALEEEEKLLCASAVLFHHKDEGTLRERYNEEKAHKRDLEAQMPVDPNALLFDDEFLALDFEWIKTFLHVHGLMLPSFEANNPLPKLTIPWKPKHPKVSEQKKFEHLLMIGSLKICDHNASAGITSLPLIDKADFTFLTQIQKPYTHQQKAWQSDGNTLLLAPTGTGKTESALGWAQKQLLGQQGRVFYVLPYTASINAMYKRLSSSEEGFGSDTKIGLLHGKARFFLDKLYEGEEGKSLKEFIDMHRKVLKPFKIVTPFQILKWAFGVKGFEQGFCELSGGCFIFDEIHVYDYELFQRLVLFLSWMIEKLHIRVFIMSATIPKFMQSQLIEKLTINTIITPDEELTNNLVRHRIELIDDVIENSSELILELLQQNKKILVVCNSVLKAQELFQAFEHIASKVLLHSRFNAKDRTVHEQTIYEKAPQLLIGTQAIEVSLNIDYDVIITELAALDALLQRFGRVYRRRPGNILNTQNINCFITLHVDKSTQQIYGTNVLQKTAEELQKINNDLLHESQVQKMLDAVYEPKTFDPELEGDFYKMVNEITPYKVHLDNEEKFNEQFDGVEVLPIQLYETWKKLDDTHEYLEAEKLFVPISRNLFHHFQNLVFTEKTYNNRYILIIRLVYDSALGLTQEEYFDNGLGDI